VWCFRLLRRLRSVYFLYGSQTGNAKSVAEELQQAAVAKGFPAICEPLNSFNSVGHFLEAPCCAVSVAREGSLCPFFALQLNPPLERARLAVILCSTTGNGDAPENAEKFWRFIKRRTQPKDLFSGLTYVVLGFGDTNYDKFWYAETVLDGCVVEARACG
jgi:sulfite reductase alpha subunit-like flavoprotein